MLYKTFYYNQQTIHKIPPYADLKLCLLKNIALFSN